MNRRMNKQIHKIKIEIKIYILYKKRQLKQNPPFLHFLHKIFT